jgi:hypothetical protein
MREAVEVRRQIAARDPSAKVIYRRHGVPVPINWSQMDPNDEHHRVVPFPSSALPNDPAGRIQALEELKRDGSIDREQYWALAGDVPDFESARDEFTAPIEFMRYQLATILDEGKYMGPWPEAPLERGIQICTSVIFLEALHGCPEEKLDLLRQWRAEALHWLGEQAPANAQGAPLPADLPGLGLPGAGLPMDPAAMGAPMLPPGMGPVDGAPIPPPGVAA